MTEEWRDIPGYEGYYQASDFGRIRSLPSERIRAQAVDKHGYPRIILYADGVSTTFTVHRLVALTFHGEKRDALHQEVDHIDYDRTNNAASNLQWVSHSENLFRRRPWPGSKGESNGFAKLSEADAISIKTALGAQSAKALAARFGVTIYTVYDIWRGRSWQHISPSCPVPRS